MDEPIVILAVLSLGLFIGVIFATVVYILAVRPRIAATDTPAAPKAASTLARQLEEQLAQVQRLHPAFIETVQQLEAKAASLAEQQPIGPRVATITGISDLLTEQARLLGELDGTEYGESLSQRARQRVLQQQLERNAATLQQLNTIITDEDGVLAGEVSAPEVSMASDEDDEDIAAQYSTILMQLDQLAKLVQEQSKKHTPAPPTPSVAPSATDESFIDFDILSDIKGIGPVFSNRLHEAGIYRFAQFANHSPEEIREILQLPTWRLEDIQDWLTQAHQLAATQAPEGQT